MDHKECIKWLLDISGEASKCKLKIQILASCHSIFIKRPTIILTTLSSSWVKIVMLYDCDKRYDPYIAKLGVFICLCLKALS